MEETSASQDESDNSVSESLDDCDYSVAEISRSFRSQQELCEQLNINHMIQRIFLITLDNSKSGRGSLGFLAGQCDATIGSPTGMDSRPPSMGDSGVWVPPEVLKEDRCSPDCTGAKVNDELGHHFAVLNIWPSGCLAHLCCMAHQPRNFVLHPCFLV